MIIKDLLGNKHTINLGTISTNTIREVRSSLHIEARKLIKELYPMTKVIEEISIPILPGQTIYFDFFIPLFKTFIEVQGQQHYEQSSLFHKNEADFLKQKKRDSDKIRWAELNEFTLIELPYNKIDEWRNILLN